MLPVIITAEKGTRTAQCKKYKLSHPHIVSLSLSHSSNLVRPNPGSRTGHAVSCNHPDWYPEVSPHGVTDNYRCLEPFVVINGNLTLWASLSIRDCYSIASIVDELFVCVCMCVGVCSCMLGSSYSSSIVHDSSNVLSLKGI